MNAEFLTKVDRNRKIQTDKLAGMLEEFIREDFLAHREILLEDTRDQLKRIQAEAEQKLRGFSTYEEICKQVDSWEYADFVNLKIIEFLNALREKKKICVNDVCTLVFGASGQSDFAEEKTEQTDFKIGPLPEPDPEDKEKLDTVKKEKAGLSQEIGRIEQEQEDAENAFRKLVREHAEIREKLEKEKPEIRYITQRVPRKGIFGFFADLFGKPQTEILEDDRDRKKWQERVDEIQTEYDAKAREWNGKMEEIKGRWRNKEEAYDKLDTEERQLEKKLKELLKKSVLEDLEACLYGDDGLSDRVITGIERDLELNEERVRSRVWPECQRRNGK